MCDSALFNNWRGPDGILYILFDIYKKDFHGTLYWFSIVSSKSAYTKYVAKLKF